MALDEWLLGALWRPSTTYLHLKEPRVPQLSWILLAIFSLESIGVLFSPPLVDGMTPSATALLVLVFLLLLLFHLYQSALLMLAARWSGWALAWPGARRLITLSWATVLLEDMITLPLALANQWAWVTAIGILCSAWQLISLSRGIAALSDWPRSRAVAVALFAVVPYRLALLFYMGG